MLMYILYIYFFRLGLLQEYTEKVQKRYKFSSVLNPLTEKHNIGTVNPKPLLCFH